MNDQEAFTGDDDRRLEKLETHAVQTSSRLDHIERTQIHHGNKLDQIFTAITKAEGRPVFDLSRTISMVRDLFAIGAVLASLSIWLVLTLTAANDRATELKIVHAAEINAMRYAEFRERIDRFSAAFSWKPSLEKTP